MPELSIRVPDKLTFSPRYAFLPSLSMFNVRVTLDCGIMSISKSVSCKCNCSPSSILMSTVKILVCPSDTNILYGIGGEFYVYFCCLINYTNYIGFSNNKQIIDDAKFNCDLYLLNAEHQLVYHGRLDDNWQNPEKSSKQVLAIGLLTIILAWLAGNPLQEYLPEPTGLVLLLIGLLISLSGAYSMLALGPLADSTSQK